MNAVMFQAFHWFLKPNFAGSNGRSLWQFLRDEADNLRNAGIDSIWIPPAYMPAGDRTNSVGYDVYDHFNLGEFEGFDRTKYGNKAELIEAINSLHGDGDDKRIQVYADIVINHKTGGADENSYWQAIRVEKENRNVERWEEGYESGLIEIDTYSNFNFPERSGMYSSFEWHAKHFDSVDTAINIRQNGVEFSDSNDKYIYRFLLNEPGYDPKEKAFSKWVSLEKGNYDYLTGCDLDYNRYDVKEEMKYWGQWLVEQLNLDGVRLDAVKHINCVYIKEWLGHIRWKAGKDIFAVSEYISGDTPDIHDFIKTISTEEPYPQTTCMFDFPLRFKFQQASKAGSAYDLRNLNLGTLMYEQPALAVTFVENHDYEYGRGYNSHVEEWFKPLAYVYILLRAGGFPCIFFPDYYGSSDWYDKASNSDEQVLWHKGQNPGKEYLDLFVKLRKQFALGEERYYANADVAGWIRMGFVPEAKGAMAVVMSNAYASVKSIKMNTDRSNKHFYHLATVKWTEGGFVIVRDEYDLYRTNSIFTDVNGDAEFLVEGGGVSVWVEEGAGLG